MKDETKLADAHEIELLLEISSRKADVLNYLVDRGSLEGRDAHFFVAGMMVPAPRESRLEEEAEDVLAAMQAARLVLPEDPSGLVSRQFKTDLSDAMVKYLLGKAFDEIKRVFSAGLDSADSE